jgi:hypothetical protein
MMMNFTEKIKKNPPKYLYHRDLRGLKNFVAPSRLELLSKV